MLTQEERNQIRNSMLGIYQGSAISDKVLRLLASESRLTQALQKAEGCLKEIRRITPYGMYHEMIDGAMDEINRIKDGKACSK